jgi:hypothetical protein
VLPRHKPSKLMTRFVDWGAFSGHALPCCRALPAERGQLGWDFPDPYVQRLPVSRAQAIPLPEGGLLSIPPLGNANSSNAQDGAEACQIMPIAR